GVKSVGVTLHSLRHTFATQSLINGADINSVAAIMGHADVSTTLRLYGHCLPGSKERAVAALGDAFDQAQARRAAGENRRP
ncbi:MAG TPA: tyrosine-type recombinase/integrase, partial [Candidatus Dormibacteraeota bacterium]|nr:tyrosine-type recombinase/integrase [Candidatus Dormibacteraeota bacterium]